MINGIKAQILLRVRRGRHACVARQSRAQLNYRFVLSQENITVFSELNQRYNYVLSRDVEGAVPYKLVMIFNR